MLILHGLQGALKWTRTRRSPAGATPGLNSLPNSGENVLRDRKQLERVCRYLLRPPFAGDAVVALPDGRVRILFKAPWRSGAAHADMPPDRFLARLCALVPPPHFHTTRYFGVFANRHHLRTRILPPSRVPAPGQLLPLDLDFAGAGAANDGAVAKAAASPRRLGWANLLARVFAVDVTVCRKCGGQMRILDVVRAPWSFPAGGSDTNARLRC